MEELPKQEITTVVIADDHTLVREGTSRMLQAQSRRLRNANRARG